MKKTNKEIVVKNEKQTTMDLLTAFQTVVKRSKGSGLNSSYFESVKEEMEVIESHLGTTAMESSVLAIIINESVCGSCTNSDLCKYFNIDGVTFMLLEKVIHSLERKRLIYKGSNNDEGVSYTIPSPLHNAIVNNESYTAPSRKCGNERDFFNHLNGLFNQKSADEIDATYLREECMGMLQENQELDFANQASSLIASLSSEQVTLFLLFCIHRYRGLKKSLTARDWYFIYDTSFDANMVENELVEGESPLIVNKLIEPLMVDGVVVGNVFTLTKLCLKKLFPGQVKDSYIEEDLCLLSYKKIARKPLFYNPETQTQVETLASLMSVKRFGQIRKRLKDSGLKGGLCCLFYGAAGAGKTELVRQLAKETGRDIFQVDLSQVRSKWIGESEKNIQELFDQYNQLLKRCKRQPILLFNEADALMNRRSTRVEQSVDKIENTIADIILQNMEDLDDGILIATTNLAETNMDPAYERRFLYKIKFDRPNPEVRQKIWGSMLKDVNEETLCSLSNEFDFTGGQIVNIIKKRLVNEVINGTQCGYADLKAFCEQERIVNTQRHSPMGFKQS